MRTLCEPSFLSGCASIEEVAIISVLRISYCVTMNSFLVKVTLGFSSQIIISSWFVKYPPMSEISKGCGSISRREIVFCSARGLAAGRER